MPSKTKRCRVKYRLCLGRSHYERQVQSVFYWEKLIRCFHLE